jgi:tetratricopeptide (TPR) repeat protein
MPTDTSTEPDLSRLWREFDRDALCRVYARRVAEQGDPHDKDMLALLYAVPGGPREEHEVAIKLAIEASEALPDRISTNERCANLLFRHGNYEASARYYRRCLELNSEDGGIRLEYARCLMYDMNYSAALSEFAIAFTVVVLPAFSCLAAFSLPG